jgi:hypothetical protein
MSARAPWVGHFGFTRTPFSKAIAAAADGKALVDDACAKKAVAEAVSE